MATPVLISALATGEISPSLFGRVDIDKERISCSTARNVFVNYRGGINSRAGTEFVGFSKQTGRDFPPRVITFQFSIEQGLMLEFGNHYMRVVSEGEFVTETPVGIGSISQTNPAVVTFGALGAGTATPNNVAVSATYAPGDLITLAGGVALSPAVLSVTSSELKTIVVNAGGTGYGVADTVTLAGGTSAPNAIATVASLKSVAATGDFTFAANPADGDTITLNGTAWTFKTALSGASQTVIKATLAATLIQLAADLGASADIQVVKCTYVDSPTQLLITFATLGAAGNAFTLAASIATRSGATLSGGTATAINAVTVSTPGVFTAVPATGNMTQSATSGTGTGATFQAAVFAPHAVTISDPGAYTSVPPNPVAQASTDGIGVGATFTMAWAASAPFANDDWVFIKGVTGMTEINGNTYRLSSVSPTSANLLDVYDDPVDATGYGAYTGSGTASRVYTLATPYAEEDLKYLKITQSADVMTICCVNQVTGTEYAPQDIARNSDTDWTFSDVVPTEIIPPPPFLQVSVSDTGGATFYAYVVTAVSPVDGTESIASAVGTAQGVSLLDHPNAQVTLRWGAVPGVQIYNIYKAQPTDTFAVPAGQLFGLIGSSYGLQFSDHASQTPVPDFATTPPRHQNPFARGQVVSVGVATGGSGFAQATATAAVVSGTGSGAVLAPIVQTGAIVAVIVLDHGQGYQPGDTVAFSGGAGATAVASIGPQTGTYPSVPGYFQQRRVFANSRNNPDTYNMSQPGAFTNFDTRLPTIDSDAITGSPWSVQVDGIQDIVQTAAGLLTMTGKSAWMLVGQGSFANNVQAISPSSQVANPLPFTGCSASIPTQKILFDVLYATPKGDVIYKLPYQGYAFTEPLDLTEYSSHLFVGFAIKEWAWTSQPFKLDWVVRDDGVALSMCYLTAEQVIGWSRHDTQGYFESVCSVTEPPVDAPYFAIQRFPGTKTAYMIERMNNRLWPTVEDSWCVDSGLALDQPTPAGTLSASSPYGLGAISGATALVGGSGYSSNTTATITDQALDENDDPIGSGATASVTVVAGVVTALNILTPGSGYQNPMLTITDPEAPAGGVADPASAHLTLDNSATFISTSASFAVADVGSVIRMGGGVATITAFTNAGQVTANITTPISAIAPNTETPTVVSQAAGEWTMTQPVTEVGGLLHLAGAKVTGLADGVVITPRVVAADGTVTLDVPASAVVIGLGFTAQVQSVPIDVGSPTIQGQRKKIEAVSLQVDKSRGVRMGVNQQDGSTLSPPQIAPTWKGMQDLPDLLLAPYDSVTVPLYTGWVRTTVPGGWGKAGQVAVEQKQPLPLNLISLVPELLLGDSTSQAIKAGGNSKAAPQ